MDSPNERAGIVMHEIERAFLYGNTTALTLSIRYPNVTLCNCPCAQERIHAEIQAQVSFFLHDTSGGLYRQAVAAYHESLENGFPFRPYEAVLHYEITYNQDCHLSLYRDQYTYTGGAHGSTVRASDTWDLLSGRRIPLSAFFPAGQDYRASLIDQMTKQADENAEVFFEDYPALIAQYFNEEHYYLTPSGVAIYYQQYEVAPYSTGIVVFTIPYMAPRV